MMELRIHFGSLDSETHILLQPLEDATWKSIQNCRCLGKTLGSARDSLKNLVLYVCLIIPGSLLYHLGFLGLQITGSLIHTGLNKKGIH